ncbi:Oidioi.mRNA.OKI2018_I69.PAR.g10219.t1.cds [Oikopleura dioica]|uniref:Oidioi.mRNA.OKI2018_I69.PAR.g10219.t1.cds n=1 Tax=Oikopleura dioica TaxID=34765 RepID=A0ABN7RT53_OIKDI|nr:Oidioi.mRNA.OKI2018_I69.PAR.g10219.t1.cds [Oikopleura dioica]
MSYYDREAWLRNLQLKEGAVVPGKFPVGLCFFNKCRRIRPYLPAFMAKTGKIACLACGNGPGSYASQTGIVPFHDDEWEVNHGPTTIKPPTIEDLHDNEISNVTSYPPLGVVNDDDVFSHTSLGSEVNDKVAENSHRSRLNTEDDDNIMEQDSAQS